MSTHNIPALSVPDLSPLKIEELQIGDWYISRIEVVISASGADIINVYIDGAPSPFIDMSKDDPLAYPPVLTVRAQKGKGLQWLCRFFQIEETDPHLTIINTDV